MVATGRLVAGVAGAVLAWWAGVLAIRHLVHRDLESTERRLENQMVRTGLLAAQDPPKV